MFLPAMFRSSTSMLSFSGLMWMAAKKRIFLSMPSMYSLKASQYVRITQRAELRCGCWKLGARQQAILCNREMEWIYGLYPSLKNNSELQLVVSLKCMTVRDRRMILKYRLVALFYASYIFKLILLQVYSLRYFLCLTLEIGISVISLSLQHMVVFPAAKTWTCFSLRVQLGWT